MCGIVGYLGKKDAREVVLSGLEKLEYRGYDSVGIALKHGDDFDIFKDTGRVNQLKNAVDFSYETTMAIGHTRWATHGGPSRLNAHPHISMSGRFILVHNGVIDNYKELKLKKLNGCSFYSSTDTEVIVNLIEESVKTIKNVENAIRKAISLLEGSYALLIIDKENPNRLYFAKNKTPLLIGEDDDGMVIGSDVLALEGYAKKYISLEDKMMGYVENKRLKLSDIAGNEEEVSWLPFSIHSNESGKGNYEHFMLKEIDEQPSIIRRLIEHYFIDDNQIYIDENLLNTIRNSDHIYICACGSSLHAGMIAKSYFEKICKIQTECLIASEVAYELPLFSKKPFFIFVSQSGETADVISVLKKCKAMHMPHLVLTNSKMSTIDKLGENKLYLYAGKEISVASTKAYISQIVTFSILAKAVSAKKTNLKKNLERLAYAIDEILNSKETMKNIAQKIYEAKDVFYIGRGLDYYACLEASLKLKEISYIHSEGYASGELKHGTIALVEKDTPVIAICTKEATNAITRSNLEETHTRGAKCFVISMGPCSHMEDDVILPDVASYLTPALSVIVCQLIAYYVAVYRNNDVDKPRNLAKSVTVE